MSCFVKTVFVPGYPVTRHLVRKETWVRYVFAEQIKLKCRHDLIPLKVSQNKSPLQIIAAAAEKGGKSAILILLCSIFCVTSELFFFSLLIFLH